MLKVTLGIVIGLVGLVIGVNIADTQQPTVVFEDIKTSENRINENLDRQIDGLRLQIKNLTDLVTEEQTLRKSIQQELSSLKQQIVSINHSEPSVTSSSSNNDTAELSVVASTSSANNSSFSQEADFRQPDSTTAVLASIGVDPSIAENIAQRSEQREMDQLYLRNKAIREGWFGTEKYFQENRKLDQSNNVIREELGDRKYDEYLFASGRFNRIKVSGVLAQSPAEQAGIQSGDVILSYNNTRVFSWSDLTTLTAEGSAGETIEVSVLRDNVVSKVFIPRGPMGVRLESLRVDPGNTSS